MKKVANTVHTKTNTGLPTAQGHVPRTEDGASQGTIPCLKQGFLLVKEQIHRPRQASLGINVKGEISRHAEISRPSNKETGLTPPPPPPQLFSKESKFVCRRYFCFLGLWKNY